MKRWKEKYVKKVLRERGWKYKYRWNRLNTHPSSDQIVCNVRCQHLWTEGISALFSIDLSIIMLCNQCISCLSCFVIFLFPFFVCSWSVHSVVVVVVVGGDNRNACFTNSLPSLHSSSSSSSSSSSRHKLPDWTSSSFLLLCLSVSDVLCSCSNTTSLTVRVETTPSATSIMFLMVSKESNIPSLSSCCCHKQRERKREKGRETRLDEYSSQRQSWKASPSKQRRESSNKSLQEYTVMKGVCKWMTEWMNECMNEVRPDEEDKCLQHRK